MPPQWGFDFHPNPNPDDRKCSKIATWTPVSPVFIKNRHFSLFLRLLSHREALLNAFSSQIIVFSSVLNRFSSVLIAFSIVLNVFSSQINGFSSVMIVFSSQLIAFGSLLNRFSRQLNAFSSVLNVCLRQFIAFSCQLKAFSRPLIGFCGSVFSLGVASISWRVNVLHGLSLRHFRNVFFCSAYCRFSGATSIFLYLDGHAEDSKVFAQIQHGIAALPHSCYRGFCCGIDLSQIGVCRRSFAACAVACGRNYDFGFCRNGNDQSRLSHGLDGSQCAGFDAVANSFNFG